MFWNIPLVLQAIFINVKAKTHVLLADTLLCSKKCVKSAWKDHYNVLLGLCSKVGVIYVPIPTSINFLSENKKE